MWLNPVLELKGGTGSTHGEFIYILTRMLTHDAVFFILKYKHTVIAQSNIHIQSKIGSIKYSSCTILEQENTTLAPMSMRFTLRCSGQYRGLPRDVQASTEDFLDTLPWYLLTGVGSWDGLNMGGSEGGR